MRGTRAEFFGRDQVFTGPDPRDRVHAVGQRLAEDKNVGLDIKMFKRPHLSGPEKTHLDLIVHHENAVIMAYFGKPFEIILRRDDITARPLDRFDEKRAELRAFCLGVPGSRVLVLELALEFMDEMIFGGFGVARKGRTEHIRERNEFGAVPEFPVSFPVTVRRRDRRRGQCAAMIPALKSEHPGTAGIFPHQLQSIFHGLGTADIKMDTSFQSEAFFNAFHHALRQFNLFTVKILASQLRKFVDLTLEGVIHAGITVTQVHGGIPHLKVQIRLARHVVKITTLTPLEDFGAFGIMDGIAVGAHLAFNGKKRFFVIFEDRGRRIVRFFIQIKSLLEIISTVLHLILGVTRTIRVFISFHQWRPGPR